MPASATNCGKDLIRIAPSSSEYSLCTRKWMNRGFDINPTYEMRAEQKSKKAACISKGMQAAFTGGTLSRSGWISHPRGS
jgi:hypothetical protein